MTTEFPDLTTNPVAEKMIDRLAALSDEQFMTVMLNIILNSGTPIPALPKLVLADAARRLARVYSDESPGWDSDTYWPPSAVALLADGGDDDHAE